MIPKEMISSQGPKECKKRRIGNSLPWSWGITNIKPQNAKQVHPRNYRGGFRCFRCDSDRHSTNSSNCFARSVTCNKCGKIGHYASVCRGGRDQSVNCVDDEKKFVFSVREDGVVDGDNLDMPKCEVLIGGREFSVLADSGSPYTMVGDVNWDKAVGDETIELLPADIHPVGYGGVKIDVLDYVVSKIQFKDRETVGKVYIAKRGDNLLGWRHQRDMGITLNPNSRNKVLLLSNGVVTDDISSNFP